MDPQRGKKMKVRLEIIDDDGTESTSVEFAGGNWKRRLMAFLDTFEDETDSISGPSSNSSINMQGNFTGIHGPDQNQRMSGQHISQPQPSWQQQQQQPANYQQPVQKVMAPRPPHDPPVRQYQMPPVQMPVLQQQPQNFYTQQAQQPMQNSQAPQYIQPNLSQVGGNQYEYGQPGQQAGQQMSPAVRPQMARQPQQSSTNVPVGHPRQRIPSASQVQRRTPRLQDRLDDMSLTINERLELFLKYEYPRVWFSSQDVQQHYERVYGDIKQSTVSTYLSRMYRKNLLERRGNRTQRESRYIGDEPEPVYQMEEMSDVPVSHRFQY